MAELADALADALANLLELLVDDPIDVEVELPDTGPVVMLPFGIPEGIPEVTPASPIVGSGALGSTVHPLADEVGHAGGGEEAEAAYAEEATPVGVKVAHCPWRLVKSGDTGVGVP